jgi:hypothetical protein
MLEITNSEAEVISIEETWKKKLMSREFGLNKN